jgi:hypothetical protein
LKTSAVGRQIRIYVENCIKKKDSRGYNCYLSLFLKDIESTRISGILNYKSVQKVRMISNTAPAHKDF